MSNLVPTHPPELGFSSKFGSWRKGQPEAIEFGIRSTKRVIAQCAPTGFGKSQVYMGQAVLEGERSCILTGTKGLMDQAMRDYGSMGLVQIRGKDNYQCISNPNHTCRDGHASSCGAKLTNECPYAAAYNKARQAKYVITNYKFWVAIHRYGGGLGTFQKLIMDEGHLGPDEVAEAMQVKLSFREIQDMLGTDFPRGTDPTSEEWKQWATQTRIECQKATVKLKSKIQSAGLPRQSWFRDYHHLQNLTQKLAIVGLMRPGDWVWEMDETGWTLDPIRFARYTESRLFLKVPKIFMYSATLRPKTLYMMGLRDGDFDFKDWPSVFDPRRSPVYYVPTMRVDARAQDLTQLTIRVDQIVGPRAALHRNGIVHVSSFRYRNEIVQNCHFREQMISHFDNQPAAQAVQRFMNSGGVLVSPSVSEGYDFTDDLCRFQILTKIPFRPRTKVISARQDADSGYIDYYAMTKVVQQAGRGTRSDADWSENYILDDHWQWFSRKNHNFAPQSFWDRYAAVNTVPRPLMVS